MSTIVLQLIVVWTIAGALLAYVWHYEEKVFSFKGSITLLVLTGPGVWAFFIVYIIERRFSLRRKPGSDHWHL